MKFDETVITKEGGNFVSLNWLNITHPTKYDGHIPDKLLMRVIGCRRCQTFLEQTQPKDQPHTAVLSEGVVGKTPTVTQVECALVSKSDPTNEILPCQFNFRNSVRVEIPAVAKRIRLKEPDN